MGNSQTPASMYHSSLEAERKCWSPTQGAHRQRADVQNTHRHTSHPHLSKKITIQVGNRSKKTPPRDERHTALSNKLAQCHKPRWNVQIKSTIRSYPHPLLQEKGDQTRDVGRELPVAQGALPEHHPTILGNDMPHDGVQSSTL